MIETLLSAAFIVGLLQAALRTATPLLLAGLGELFGERSGILNIGLEGIMLLGCLIGFVVANLTGIVWLGILAGGIAGVLVSLIHALLSINLGVNQVVSGVGINIFCSGLSLTLYRAIYGMSSSSIPRAPSQTPVYIPFLSDIPVLGPFLFSQLPLVYFALVLVPVSWFILYRTEFGLKVRAAGEHPLAAETLGINVAGIRYICVMTTGLLTGFAGTFLSLGLLNIFRDNMTAGRGWIAIAVVIFGRWKPGGILMASIIFGIATAFQLRLQAIGVDFPYQFLLMIPYVLTMVILIVTHGRSTGPATLGKPFIKEG
jgi:general nucleoside transport system permease protein